MKPNPPEALDALPMDALDAALAHALPAPALPPGFPARVQAARLREQAVALGETIAQRRIELQALHERERALLKRGQAQQRLSTMATVASISFALGAVATASLPWLQAQTGWEASLLMPVLACALGAAVGLGAWLARAGKLRLGGGLL